VLRALQVFFGVVASLLALLMLVIAGWAASFTHHNVNGYEREHLDAAVQFVREQERIKGAIPDSEQFTEWARSMDSKGHFALTGTAMRSTSAAALTLLSSASASGLVTIG
jgi:ketosteroid isomerase-like protein